ncbi:ribosome small subunit-dependent GTPase A [Rhodobacteraceae bacterium]|nr:ribosome small subunit-dependent GTPase A [Paracoccaceae bacterium]
MTNLTYAQLGWSRFFATLADADETHPLRVAEVHRNAVSALAPEGPQLLNVPQSIGPLAVGDWVTAEDDAVIHRFERQSTLERRAPGEDVRTQLIAANVTTLGIVSSCNADFNIRRLERYLILAADAGCLPLVILTKADQTDDIDDYVRKTTALSPLVTVLALNARDAADIALLHPWCREADTLALVGSSGVGKTTIRNALTGDDAATQDIREDDARGRHTTTSRALVRTKAGGWLIDTPGMRALRLFDVGDGLQAVFADIEELAQACRFNDCAHETEPGCKVQDALADGRLESDRIARWKKLKAEDLRNSESIAKGRARAKAFQKGVNSAVSRKRNQRKD